MKTSYWIILTIVGFLVLSTFGGIKSCQVRKLIEAKTKIETENALIRTQKEEASLELSKVNKENSTIKKEKAQVEQSYLKYVEVTDKQIKAYKDKISTLSSIPVDTVYEVLFSRHPAFSQPLLYRFAENQIRGFHLDIIERDHFESVYISTSNSLKENLEINVKNDKLIANLEVEKSLLIKNQQLSDKENSNLQENIKITEKALNKQKRTSWIYKGGTLIAIVEFFLLLAK